MNGTIQDYVDESTVSEKALACLSGFGMACATFVFAAAVVLPFTAKLAALLAIPDSVVAVLMLLLLFGLPVTAAICGVAVTGRSFAENRSSTKPTQ